MIHGADIIIEWTGHIWANEKESTEMLRITPTGQVFVWRAVDGAWTDNHDIAAGDEARHIHAAALARKYLRNPLS